MSRLILICMSITKVQSDAVETVPYNSSSSRQVRNLILHHPSLTLGDHFTVRAILPVAVSFFSSSWLHSVLHPHPPPPFAFGTTQSITMATKWCHKQRVVTVGTKQTGPALEFSFHANVCPISYVLESSPPGRATGTQILPYNRVSVRYCNCLKQYQHLTSNINKTRYIGECLTKHPTAQKTVL